MTKLALALAVSLLACGGSSGDAERADAAPAALSTSPGTNAAAEPGSEREGYSASAAGDLPLRTITTAKVPDPCALLSGQDAAELLGEPVGSPHQPDAGGYPCVYRGTSGESEIALDMALSRGPSVDGTQFSINLEYCQGEAVAEIEDLGLGAALFRMKNEDCNPHTLWVSTGVYFRGTEANPYTGRTPEGHIHFTFTLRPAVDEETTIDKLGTAARRALSRLPE